MKQIVKSFIVLAVLFAGVWLAEKAMAAGAGNPYACANFPELRQGNANTCVQYAKWELNKQLTPSPNLDDEDNNFDAAMKTEVLKFQNANGLRCKEGIIGPETWNKLVPSQRQTGPCVDPPATNTNTGTTNNAVAPECKQLEDNFKDFAGGTPGPLASNCYSSGQAINRVITILFTLVALLAVLFVVIGGYRYMTSGGDEKKAGSGKTTIKWALLGLALTFFAYMIVRIVRSLVAG